MKGLAAWFMTCGVLAVLIGMAWGIQMAIGRDHMMAPAHAHLNLLGFVSFSIFAFYYHLVPEAASAGLARLHFALSAGGLVTVVPGIVLDKLQVTEALAAIGSILTALGMVCFLLVVLRSRARAVA